jgi:hypothetical protein
MIRVQFSLRTVFVVMTACALLLAWWAPAQTEVRFANILFPYWADGPVRRVTTEQELFASIGGKRDPLEGAPPWPDFAKLDVIAVPTTRLAGEPPAAYRVPALDKLVDVNFHNTPLREAVEVLNAQAEPGKEPLTMFVVDPKMRITFSARGTALRDVLRSILQPRGLTFAITPSSVATISEGEARGSPSVVTVAPTTPPAVIIMSQRDARNTSMTCCARVFTGGRWTAVSPEFRHRLRFRGKLALITSFVDWSFHDSAVLGYAMPKGVKVFFVTERMANAIDAGYTLLVILVAVALAAYPNWLPGRRRR